MSLLILDGVQKHFGSREVLRGASLRVDPGDKVGLVGRNGGGKTTILRLIEGLESPDWGSVTLRKGASLGHVPQRPEFPAGRTVREHVEGGLEEARSALAELEHVNHAMAGAAGDDLARLLGEHDRLAERVRVLGGWETTRNVETVLSGIGIGAAMWEREARTLSGGERSRIALARELVCGHDLLLLDEPTNHLDLPGIEWMEAWLRELRGAVLIVSHDRRLLENAVDVIFDLEGGELTRYPGSFSAYLRIREERFLAASREYEIQQDFLRKEEAFIRKHMGSQRTAEAKGRQKKLENLARIQRPYHDVRRPVIRAPKAERGGETVLQTHDLAGGYPGAKPVIAGVELRIARGDRIGIVGRNGTGKTTLLRILAGRLAPLKGALELGHRAVCGYFDQDTSDLAEDGTPYTEIRRRLPQATDQEIRDHLARFLFRGTEIDAVVSTLSGGERARLSLAKLVLTKPSWLAMDEPTNHLDLAARTALEEMLGEFEGAMVFVSHDRAFLDELCTRILEVADGRVTSFEGNYSDWRAANAAEKAERKPSPPAPKPVEKASEGAKKPAPGKLRNPWLFEKLEKRIMTLEEELKGLQDATATEEVYRDTAKLREMQTRMAEIERDLVEANHEWENWQ
ncbi:MAG: ABC-F family ATP-binding cassette domain-containing protein [Planctomycetota bacterium]